MLKFSKKILILVFYIFVFSNITSSQESNDYYKIEQVFDYMEDYYVDSVDITKTINEVIIATLKELDPHSIYISKEEVEKINQPLEGSFEGIGVYYNILQDTIVIISPISGGPSEKVGIKAGDRIVKVEGENIANIGITTEGVKERLLGQKGTNVQISIKRRGIPELLEFIITRDEIPIFSIDAAYMIDDEVGYIKLNRFSATTVNEFDTAIKKLEKEGLKHLIFDLRDNGGGYLSTSIDISDEFLKKNELIVFTEGVNSTKKEYFATNDGHFEKGRLVVLIDEGSASASEIVTGSIQDWDRGVIIGRRSFGKGLVQRPFNLIDGSVIRLTIARYYTPTGRLIQKPYEEGVDKYKEDIEKRFEKGELLHGDSIHFQDSLKYSTLNNKRVVYGGGGIMPDIFVPLDTTSLPEYYNNWIQKGIFNDFLLKYTDENREFLLTNYPVYDDFFNNFAIPDDFYRQLIDYSSTEDKDSINITIEMLLENEEMTQYQIKALIARNLWTTSEYYQIINLSNAAYMRAVEIIKDKNLYENELKY
jgi:carboxyl-terminal processing protease